MIKQLMHRLTRKNESALEIKETAIRQDARQHARMSQERTNCIVMSIAKFGSPDKADLSVRAVDISAGGVGVESDVPLAPGFVWFRDAVGHHQCGVVVWTRVFGDNTLRSGVKFTPPGTGHEIMKPASAAPLYPPSCRAPELVSCMLVDEVLSVEG